MMFYILPNVNAKKRLFAVVDFWSGFFSVWMTVFDDYPKVKKVLIASFAGTASDAFDENQNSIKRTVIL